MMYTLLRSLAIGLLLVALAEAVALAHAVTPRQPTPVSTPAQAVGAAAGIAAVELARR